MDKLYMALKVGCLGDDRRQGRVGWREGGREGEGDMFGWVPCDKHL